MKVLSEIRHRIWGDIQVPRKGACLFKSVVGLQWANEFPGTKCSPVNMCLAYVMPRAPPPALTMLTCFGVSQLSWSIIVDLRSNSLFQLTTFFYRSLLFLRLILFVFMCMCIGVCMCLQVPVEAENRTSDTLIVVTGYLMWVLGIELRSFARAIAVLNCWPIIRVLLEKRHIYCLLIVCSCFHSLGAVA